MNRNISNKKEDEIKEEEESSDISFDDSDDEDENNDEKNKQQRNVIQDQSHIQNENSTPLNEKNMTFFQRLAVAVWQRKKD